MTRIPDFSEIAYAAATSSDATSAAAAVEPWMTPEGIPVKGHYGPEDRAGIEFLDTYP
ncbi:MAG: hypothetical protein INR63_20175, partial [Actinomycetospora chiangmaiensis]|nr:hypothetical protein [Actinomycetospora chiangmaiensis]